MGAFVDYGLAHPAFTDCAQALMRRSGPELLDEISESALFRLGRGISGCLAILQDALQAGVDAGTFRVDDPTLLANTLYASGLGALQLARVGILVTETSPGIPTVGEISPAQVRATSSPPRWRSPGSRVSAAAPRRGRVVAGESGSGAPPSRRRGSSGSPRGRAQQHRDLAPRGLDADDCAAFLLAVDQRAGRRSTTPAA